jgi:predicted DNA-binding transcriptional regulator YafY
MAVARQKRFRVSARALTAERIARLFQLVMILGRKPIARIALLRRLRINQRGFYRDIEHLRRIGIGVIASDGQYALQLDVDSALSRLPFPDPRLTLGDAIQLAKGRSKAHQQLRSRVNAIVRPKGR